MKEVSFLMCQEVKLKREVSWRGKESSDRERLFAPSLRVWVLS